MDERAEFAADGDKAELASSAAGSSALTPDTLAGTSCSNRMVVPPRPSPPDASPIPPPRISSSATARCVRRPS